MVEDHRGLCLCPIQEDSSLAVVEVRPIYHGHDLLEVIKVVLVYDQRYSQLTLGHHVFCNLVMLVACVARYCPLDYSSSREHWKMFRCEGGSNYRSKLDLVRLQGLERRLCQCRDIGGDGQRA